jgi:hypothetical protein
MTVDTLILFGIFVVLQALDALLTLHILSRGGRELNPVMAWAMDRVGPATALATMKLALVVAVFAVLPWLPVWTLIVLCLAYTAIAVWNRYQLERMRG